MLQAWQIRIVTPRTGPRGGRAAPLINSYSVTAETREEARALFDEEMGHQILPTDEVGVFP